MPKHLLTILLRKCAPTPAEDQFQVGFRFSYDPARDMMGRSTERFSKEIDQVTEEGSYLAIFRKTTRTLATLTIIIRRTYS